MLVIPLQLPTPHCTTITSGGGGGACDFLQLHTPHATTITSGGGVGVRDSPSATHTTLSTTITSGGGGGACDSPSVTQATLWDNHFLWSWWGLCFPFRYPRHILLPFLALDVGLVIHLQLPTPHSTTITSGGCGWACDSS